MQGVNVADLDDGLECGRQVAPFRIEYWCTRADLALPRRGVHISAELIIEPPASDLLPNRKQLRRSYRVEHFGQYALVRSERALKGLPSIRMRGRAAEFGERPPSLDQHTRRPHDRPAPHDLPFDLRIEIERRGVVAFRQAKVDQVREVAGCKAQLQADWPRAYCALNRVPAGADPMRAALERARSELPKGSRVILFDLAGTDDAPSAVNTITL